VEKIVVTIVVFINICLANPGSNKPYIAVLDFGSPVLSESELISITNQFRSNLVRLNSYTVINRNKMEVILEEQSFQMSGCTEEECAVEVGRLLNVSYIFYGEVGKIGKTYTIDISSVNVETGQINKSYSKSFIGEKDDFLRILDEITCEISGIKYKQTFYTYKYIASIGTVTSASLGVFSYLKSQDYYEKHQNSISKSAMEGYKNLTIKYRNYSYYCAIASGCFIIYYFINKSSEKKNAEKVNVEISGNTDSIRILLSLKL